MADEKRAQGQQVHAQSRQPINAVDISAPRETMQPANAEGTQPISIPGSSSSAPAGSANFPIISPTSPSKYQKKTGTRSTFCSTTSRKGTKLTEEDYEHHEKNDRPVPTGWLQMLGLKKSANYGDPLYSQEEPQQQSYY
ncbi:hypothetical protein BX616_008500 [Lobosporangium transversale]|nr:hypothetical protein BX616_008500 [Lobosporangium transversale]